MHRRRTRVAALVALAAAVAAPVAALAFFAGEQPVRVGAHTATASPTLDGRATLVVGGLVPSVRIDSGLPLGMGVEVIVVRTEADSLPSMVQRDAVIASAPDGEVDRVRGAVVDLAVASLVRGAAAGAAAALAAAALWTMLGATRRAELARSARSPRGGGLLRWPPRHPVLGGALVATVALVATAVVLAPGDPTPDEEWTPVDELVPEAALVPELSGVEVQDGTTTEGGVTLIRGAISTYRESVTYYDDLAERVATAAADIRQPAAGELVAVLVTDRHDNVGMDRVARAIGDAGGAELLVDAGDDTASGGAWEDFSIDSLAAAFDGYDVVSVAGNHDGPAVAQMMRDAGFTVLDGEPVDVAGIEFLGAADPRSSGFGSQVLEGDVPFDEVAGRLRDAACSAGSVSTVVVHSPTMGLPVAESGCVDLVLSGHLHRQVGPDTVRSDGGRTTTTFTNGTTGGAAYAFALGSSLRRPAQVTLVTFADGRSRGLQPVDIDTDGAIEVQRYQPLEPAPQAEARG